MNPQVGEVWHGLLSCNNVYLILGFEYVYGERRCVTYVIDQERSMWTYRMPGTVVMHRPYGYFKHQAKDCSSA